MAIPVVALLIVASLSSGGVDGMFITLERTLRHTFAAVVDALRGLF